MPNLDPEKLTPQKWSAIKALLSEALEEPEEARSSFVANRCSSDPEVGEWVNHLLSDGAEPTLSSPFTANGGTQGGEFPETLGAFSNYYAKLPTTERLDYLERAQNARSASPATRGAEISGSISTMQIGPYRLLKEIGRGGMGVVYLAKRVDDFEEEVAIKVLARGEEGARVFNRFLSERQMLASLDHPNIVRLLDGGTTQEGTPYIVMEYITGEPILRYCEDHHLRLEERLELFCKLCSAVQYAHQRLVVHRDLKPSNVLVTADGTPKLLDFGIAKVLTDEHGSLTGTLAALTPEYASPEQIRGEALTTATDVYSLGMLLYEMLTGVRPYSFSGRGMQEIVKAVCDEEAELPSAALKREPGNAAQPLPATWQKQLRGDLDTIAVKALHKEAARRYASVERLREDIQCYLKGLPVSARPDTVLYRWGKYLRRRWDIAAIALCLLVSIMVGTTLTWVAMVRAEKERARAEERLYAVHRLTNSLVFDVNDQIRTLPGSTPVQKHLVDLAAHYLPALEQDAGEDAATLRDVSDAYERLGDLQGNPRGPNLGDSAGAMVSFNKALQVRQKLKRVAPNDYTVDLALSRTNERIADMLWSAGNPRAKDAYESAQANLDRAENIRPNDPDVLARQASTSDDLGDLAYEAKDYRTAMDHFSRELQCATRMASLHPGTLQSVKVLAIAHMKIGRVLDAEHEFGGALREGGKALEIRSNFAKANPGNTVMRRELAANHIELGETYEDSKNYSSAAAQLREAVAELKGLIDADPQNQQYRTDMKLAQEDLQRVVREIAAHR